MQKLINKITCFLAVFILCVPLFCFSVGASAYTVNPVEKYYSKHLYTGGTRSMVTDYMSDLKLSDGDISKFPYTPICISSGDEPTNCVYDYSNSSDVFRSFMFSLYNSKAYSLDEYNELKLFHGQGLYYVMWYGDYTAKEDSNSYTTGSIKQGDVFKTAYIMISLSPLSINSDGYFCSENDIYLANFSALPYYQSLSITYSNLSKITDGSNSRYKFMYNSGHNTALNPDILKDGYGINSIYNKYTTKFTYIYSNISDLKFPDNYQYDFLGGTGTLSDYINVKLTPEFKVGMDRTVPENIFGGMTSDYFALEVTNNNNFNIQFQFYILPATGNVEYAQPSGDEEYKKFLKEQSNSLPISINSDGLIPKISESIIWKLEKEQWVYSKETSNQADYFSDKAYLVNKPTSDMFVKAGCTFKQVVKWNQLNINKNQPYQLFVIACECPYDRASDIHTSLASNEYSQSFKHVPNESYFFIYDTTFSVINPLYFDADEKHGGVIANTGQSQVDKDYWKMGAIEKNGEIEVRNEDYANGWRLDIDGGSDHGPVQDGLFNNLDDISLKDVSKLVTDTTAYFTVMSKVFTMFPSWVWILLFAGISGLVVIGIFKALK